MALTMAGVADVRSMGRRNREPADELRPIAPKRIADAASLAAMFRQLGACCARARRFACSLVSLCGRFIRRF